MTAGSYLTGAAAAMMASVVAVVAAVVSMLTLVVAKVAAVLMVAVLMVAVLMVVGMMVALVMDTLPEYLPWYVHRGATTTLDRDHHRHDVVDDDELAKTMKQCLVRCR